MELDFTPVLPVRRDFRIGILGGGVAISQYHLPAYRKAGISPAAIWSRTFDHATRVADEYRIPTVYEDYEQLLDNPDLDVLDLALPPDAQRLLIEAACSKKTVKGILAEVPLARTYDEAAKLVEGCEEAGIRLAVNQNMRYDPSVIAVKQLLENGTIGEPIVATVEARAPRKWHDWQRDLGFLTLRNLSIHHLDTFRYWFGEPEGVYCSLRRDPRIESEHSDGLCIYILEYGGGLRCLGFDDTWAGPTQDEGSTGRRLVRRVEGLKATAIAEGDPNYTPLRKPTVQYATKSQPEFQSIAIPQDFPSLHASTMAQLLVAIEAGNEPPISGRDHLKTLELVEAAYESAKQFSSIGMDRIRKILAAPSPPTAPKSAGLFDRLFGKPKELETTAASWREEDVLYTPLATQALRLARKEAERFNHSFIGTEHLLLGLLSLGKGVAINVLAKQGVTVDQLRQIINKEIGTGPEQSPFADIRYTPRSKRVLALAVKEMKNLNHTYMGTEHILLGLLVEGDGVASRVLHQLGVEPKPTRTLIIKELDPNAARSE